MHRNFTINERIAEDFARIHRQKVVLSLFEMTSHNILLDDRSRSAVPVLSRLPTTDRSRRDNDENQGSQRAVPSFLVVFNDDEVTISSRKQIDNDALNDRFAAGLPVPENTRQIAESRNLSPDLVVKSAGMALSSESVQNGRSFGPYDIQINRYAMKRYHEASSFRAWHTSTIEITA